jgi:hypothetical protein
MISMVAEIDNKVLSYGQTYNASSITYAGVRTMMEFHMWMGKTLQKYFKY